MQPAPAGGQVGDHFGRVQRQRVVVDDVDIRLVAGGDEAAVPETDRLRRLDGERGPPDGRARSRSRNFPSGRW